MPYPIFEFDFYTYMVNPTSPTTNHMYLIMSIPKNHNGSTLTINPYYTSWDQSIHFTLPDQSQTIHTFMPISNAGWLLAPPTDDIDTSNHPYFMENSGYSGSLDPSYNKYYHSPLGINAGAPVGAPYNINATTVLPYNYIYRALGANGGIRVYLDNTFIGEYTRGSLAAGDYITNLRNNTEKIGTSTTNLSIYPFDRPVIQVDTSLTWSVDSGNSLSISLNDILDSSSNWSITPSLPDGLIFTVVTSSMAEITGTPNGYDVIGTNYTISAANASGYDMQVQININVRDEWITRALVDTADSSVAEAINWTISGDDIVDFSGYIDSQSARRNLINLMFTRSQNSSASTMHSTKADLQLPTFFTKDNIVIHRSNTEIDLATISPDQGVYVPTYYDGETVTFLNTGGLQTVVFTVSGDGVYKYSINDVESEETFVDGEEVLIAGVSFIFGSIGTEGTNNGNICMRCGTPVRTVRGDINIEDLKIGDILVRMDGGQSTICNVIRTINEDPYYYQIPQNYYSANMPYQDVVLSGEHQVQDRCGSWISARSLDGVEKIAMNPGHEYVYNVYTEDYTPMCVAGIAVETVHHNNINIRTRARALRI